MGSQTFGTGTLHGCRCSFVLRCGTSSCGIHDSYQMIVTWERDRGMFQALVFVVRRFQRSADVAHIPTVPRAFRDVPVRRRLRVKIGMTLTGLLLSGTALTAGYTLSQSSATA